ncbi:MAG: hypothetical protein WDN23_19565 [Edaphobacter sp.]
MGRVVGGVVVDDFDVGDEAGAGVGAFDEVVREERVTGEAAVEDLLEDADLVDAFAGEDALAEEVLIDVGDGAGVDVEAGLAGVERGKAGAGCGGDADADARLEDPVSGGDDAEFGINDGLVERVGHSADHACGGAAGELGVGVKRDDVTDVVEELERTGFEGKAVVLIEEKFIEVEELAALALPAHPDTLARIEAAMAMEEKEGAAVLAGIFCVEIDDTLCGEQSKGVGVFVERTDLDIREIGEEAEVDVGVLIVEVAGFELVEELVDLLFSQQKRGNDDEGGGFGWDPFGEVDLGERVGLHQGGDGVVDEVDGALRRRDESEKKRSHDRPEGVVRNQRRNDGDDEQTGEGEDAEDVEVFFPSAEEAAQALDGWAMVVDALAEGGEAFGEEVVADVGAAVGEARIGVPGFCGLAGEVEGNLRCFDFAGVGVPGQLGDA